MHCQNKPDAVKKWLDAYKKYGVDGLNSKEVTFFGSSNDTSNLEALADAFSFSRNAKEKAQTYLNDRLNNFTASASVYFDSATSSNSYLRFLVCVIFKEKSSLTYPKHINYEYGEHQLENKIHE